MRRASTRHYTDPFASEALDDPQAELLARAVRRVALAAQERTRRNEYPGMYTGLYRQFNIAPSAACRPRVCVRRWMA